MSKKTQKFVTEEAGNTNTASVEKELRARAYQLTINSIDRYEKIKEYLMKSKSFNYLISCKEVAPTTGKEHIHIYVHYKNATKLNIKKILGAHVECCRGSPQQNIAYIEKDGNIIDEIGEKPRQGMMKIGELVSIENEKEIPWSMYNTWKKAKTDIESKLNIMNISKEVKVYYIQGPSGTGKTKLAHKIIRGCVEKYGEEFSSVKFDGNFWLGTYNNKVALYDDFRDSHMKPSEFINFIDYNRQQMNIKGSSRVNNYELIIITSVQNLSDIYKNISDEPRKQWERRITLINIETYEEEAYENKKEIWQESEDEWSDGPSEESDGESEDEWRPKYNYIR